MEREATKSQEGYARKVLLKEDSIRCWREAKVVVE